MRLNDTLGSTGLYGLRVGTLAQEQPYCSKDDALAGPRLTGDDGETYECELTTSDLQFAFSIYGTVEVGDDVIVVCSGSTESEDGDTTYRVTDFLED